MAVIDLGTLTLTGQSQVTLTGTLAVKFVTASGSSVGSMSATLAKITGALGMTSAGQSGLSSAVNRARALGATVSAQTAIALDGQRRRGLSLSAAGSALMTLGSNGRRSISATINAQATVAPALGVKRSMPTLSSAGKATTDLAGNKGGSVAQDIFVQVTGTPIYNNDADPIKGTPGSWTVPVTLKRGGVLGTRIPTGSAVVKWGEYSATPTTDFTGGLILTSDLANAPYIDVFTVYKNLGGTVSPWDDAALKPRVRMGNLKGVLGNSTDEWGIAMSTDLSDSTKPYIKASNNGLVIKDADLNVVGGNVYFGDAGQTKYMKWDKTSLTVKGTINADSGSLGNLNITGSLVTGVSPNPRIEITSAAITGYSDATTKEFYINSADGKAYAGDGSIRIHKEGIDFYSSGTSEVKRSMHFVDGTGTRFATVEGIVNSPTDFHELALYADGLSVGKGMISLLSQGIAGSEVLIESAGNYTVDPSTYIDLVNNISDRSITLSSGDVIVDANGLDVYGTSYLRGSVTAVADFSAHGQSTLYYPINSVRGGTAYTGYTYVPITPMVVWNATALAANTTYTITPGMSGGNAYAKGYAIRIGGQWTTANSAYYVGARQTSTSSLIVIARAQVAGLTVDTAGVVNAEAGTGNFYVTTGTAAATASYLIIEGYYI